VGQRLELFQASIVEAGVDGVVAVGAFLQGATTSVVERLDPVAHHLGDTAQLVGNLLGTFVKLGPAIPTVLR